MEKSDAIEYLTKEILKVFAENRPAGNGQTVCTYGSSYGNVIAFHTAKEEKIQYHISFVVSIYANVNCSVVIHDRSETKEPAKERIYFFDKLDTRTDMQKKAISRVTKFLTNQNTIYKARLLEHRP